MYQASLAYRCLHHQAPSPFKICTNAYMETIVPEVAIRFTFPMLEPNMGNNHFYFKEASNGTA